MFYTLLISFCLSLSSHVMAHQICVQHSKENAYGSSLNSRYTLHNLPLWASCGVSVVSQLWVFRRKLMVPLTFKENWWYHWFLVYHWSHIIWVRSRNCGCLVTWFCYQLIAKPGNKTAAVLWPDPYAIALNKYRAVQYYTLLHMTSQWLSAKVT